MPLSKGAKPGSKAFGENIATEIKAGKPPAQAEAIAYSEAKDDSDDFNFRKRQLTKRFGKLADMLGDGPVKKELRVLIAKIAGAKEDADLDDIVAAFNRINMSGKTDSLEPSPFGREERAAKLSEAANPDMVKDDAEKVKTDSAGPRLDPTHRAAGILFLTKGESPRRALFLKRGPGGDYPGYWCFPGGHLEGNETPEEAAKREAIEEIGSLPKGERTLLARNISLCDLAASAAGGTGAASADALPVAAAPEAPLPLATKVVDFTTFLQEVDAPFDVVKDGEHTGFAWAPISDPPQPLHPGCEIAARRYFADELGVARMMAAGELTSPQVYRNMTLWAMRITGTGVSYRSPVLARGKDGKVVLDADKKPTILEEEEFPWRDPSIYLNDEFLARCNGLPVIAGHPKSKTLNSKEFDRRIVGTVFLPYIRGDEVWGIAKVWDDESNAELEKDQYSTSPAVVISDPENPSYKFRLENGSLLLVEGKPSLLDHLALCERGVWDKGGEAAGVDNHNLMENETMADEVKTDSAKPVTLEDVMAAVGGIAQRVENIGARVDAMEKDDSEKEKTDEEKAKEKADAEEKEKADAEEKAKADAEEEEKKKAAAEKEKADAEKGEGKAEEVAADAFKKADAACAKADSAVVENKALKSRIADLEKRLPAERNDDDHRTMTSYQAKADSVYELFGKQAPRFLPGEAGLAYRRRLVEGFKEHSTAWKPVELATLADAAFTVAEEQIYADAAVAAKNAEGVEDGGLRMVPGTTPSGHKKVEFFGRTSALLNRFSGVRRYATSIRPNTNKSEVA